MLNHLSGPPVIRPDQIGKTTLWIDLLRPGEAEKAHVQQVTGLSVPSLGDLQEIERSSRLYIENDALYLSLPVVSLGGDGLPQATPIGFVLARDRLITVHFTELSAFAGAAERARGAEAAGQDSAHLFVILVEQLIETLADLLERVSDDIDRTSHRIFRNETGRPMTPSRFSQELRVAVRQTGRTGALITKASETLLGLGRMVPFVEANADWLAADLKPRLRSIRRDVGSLNEHSAHISAQVQFLLDASLGLINIEQNNIIKVLAVVGTVGVPPTLIASIYGMNFEIMPELHFVLGYPMALALIVLSALVPLWWFRRRGWL